MLRTALVAWLCVLAAVSTARAQPDAQARRPSLARGDLLLVRGAGVLPAGESAIGLDADYVRRPIVLIDRVTGTERAAVRSRLTTTLMYAFGIGARSQVTLAVPLAWQEGEGRRSFSRDPNDELPRGAAGDVRLDFLHALAPAPAPEHCAGCNVGVAFASGLSLPTGDEEAFAGGPGFGAYVDAIGAGLLGPLIVQASFGVRIGEESSLGGVATGSEMSFAVGAALPLLDARLVITAESQALIGLQSDSSSPILFMGGARVVLGEARRADVALGVGTGLTDALRAPAFEAVIAVRYVP